MLVVVPVFVSGFFCITGSCTVPVVVVGVTTGFGRDPPPPPPPPPGPVDGPGETTGADQTVRDTVVALLWREPSLTINVKLSEPIYQSAGVYVKAPLEARVSVPCVGIVLAVNVSTGLLNSNALSTSIAVRVPVNIFPLLEFVFGVTL